MDGLENKFIKFMITYLRFLMTLERVNSLMILPIYNIYFLHEMSPNVIKIALV